MAAVLMALVIVNAGVTGWLLAKVRGMRVTIANLAKTQVDIESEVMGLRGE